jgi:carbon-monoxide dehydrogenase large subunit
LSSAQVTVQKGKRLVGQSLKRTEDPKFITGSGMYLDDLRLPEMLYAVFVRSPHAHAKILKIDVTPALSMPGVVAAMTGTDIDGKVGNMPTIGSGGEGEGVDEDSTGKRGTVWKALSMGEVNFIGEAVAVVFADSMYAATDAAEAVEVDYDPLDAVIDVEAALKPGSPRVHTQYPNNIAFHNIHRFGEVEEAFKKADVVVKVKLLNQRVHPVSLEPRGVAASYDGGNGILTIWLSTQDPNSMRNSMAELLRMNQAGVRVIAPDVGGGFGGKAAPYPEDIVVCYAAMHLHRPIKWEETRREHMMTMTHGRGQSQAAEIAVRKDGKILGYKIRVLSDGGAYSDGSTTGLPALTGSMGTGVYDIPAYEADIYSMFTNKVPHGAYRGAGRPEAAYLIERTMNVLAAKLKLDPIKLRQANYIDKGKFPFKTPGGFTYDSADYEANLAVAMRVSGYQKLRQEQREARAAGRLVGVGVVTWTEVCGFGPGSAQTAAVTVNPDGSIVIAIGGEPHGQGHAMPMIQLAADELGVYPARFSVRHGDTNMLPWSSVTAGSRSAALTGSATLLSARKVREKMSKIAANKLGLAVTTPMVFADEKIYPEGSPSTSLKFEEVAEIAYHPPQLPPGMEATLFEYTAFSPKSLTFPFGTHVAVVEVDRETGVVKLLKYFAIDDCGNMLNPMLVEGQVHGGIAQGVGQAMLEELVYDENGQLLSSTLADYLLPTADTIPDMVLGRTETPTFANPLGVKGIGEAGSIASTPVVVNAVEDALAEFNVVVEKMPLRSDYIKSLMNSAKKKNSS